MKRVQHEGTNLYQRLIESKVEQKFQNYYMCPIYEAHISHHPF